MSEEKLKQELERAKKEALFWKVLSQKNAELLNMLLNHQN